MCTFVFGRIASLEFTLSHINREGSMLSMSTLYESECSFL